MGIRTASRSAAAEREHHRTNLWAQLARFVGLYLSPLIGLLASWLIHLWVVGLSLHWWVIDWEIRTSPAAVTVAICLITLATVLVAYLAWNFAEHRMPILRASLAGSIVTVGLLFAINVGTGPHYWWSGLLLVAGWSVAIVWSIARLDVTRNDKNAEEREDQGILGKLKGWRIRGATTSTGADGKPLATVVDFQHADGDTVEDLQDAVPNIESVAGSPRGMSNAVPNPNRADRSTLRLMHQDPLRHRLMLPPLSSPGGSIVAPLHIGTYATGEPALTFLGGTGPEAPDVESPSNYLFMGMSRAGKTVTENEMLSEAGSRRGVVFLYLNKSKGMQDWRPISPLTEVAVIEDDAESGGKYRIAMKAIQAIMNYRQRQLGTFGISAWSAARCFDNRPWRTDPDTGKRVQMEAMPLLICHVGEADSILASNGGDLTRLASKCLSLGVALGFSMQRASFDQMPTSLRFNIGTAYCFGTSDDASAEFALSDSTVKAGAHPENWRNRKPGYFYMEGLGIDESMFPVHIRSFGDETNESLQQKLLSRSMEWGPRMAKLDRGSALATEYENDGGGKVVWWDEMARQTESLRRSLLADAPATSSATLSANRPATSYMSAGSDDDEVAEFDLGEDDDDIRNDLEAEMRETTHVDGVELYPRDDETGQRGKPADADAPLPQAEPEDEVTWGDTELPAPRDRQAAIDELRRVMGELFSDESLRDPADPTGNTVIITSGLLADRYRFRSRPFFVEILAQMAAGTIEVGGGLVLTHAPDLGLTKGKYRLQRLGG